MSTRSVASLQNPIMRGVKLSGERQPQERHGGQLPEGLLMISADSHWEVSRDIFHERFPERLRDKAPRVWFDRYWHVGYPGVLESYGTPSPALDEALARTVPSGVWDMTLRRAHMDAEGVQKEVVFPQSLLGFIRYQDLEVQEWLYRVYNEHIAECSNESAGRFNGVGICSNWWDPRRAREAVSQIVQLGLKTFMLPVSPGKNPGGKDLNYADPEMDPLWKASADAGLPVNFHVGENALIQQGRGALGTYMMTALAPFRKPLGQLIFGGVFDRYPDLKVVFTEGGISWIAPALQDAEMVYDTFCSLLDPPLLHRPSDYWHSNCYATFQNDRLGLESLRYIGADRVMWANDYPHTEGSFGYTWSSVQSVLDTVDSADDARMILGATAAALYQLN